MSNHVCPLFRFALIVRLDPNCSDGSQCIHERCAWWRDGECAVTSIAVALSAMESRADGEFMTRLFKPD